MSYTAHIIQIITFLSTGISINIHHISVPFNLSTICHKDVWLKFVTFDHEHSKKVHLNYNLHRCAYSFGTLNCVTWFAFKFGFGLYNSTVLSKHETKRTSPQIRKVVLLQNCSYFIKKVWFNWFYIGINRFYFFIILIIVSNTNIIKYVSKYCKRTFKLKCIKWLRSYEHRRYFRKESPDKFLVSTVYV